MEQGLWSQAPSLSGGQGERGGMAFPFILTSIRPHPGSSLARPLGVEDEVRHATLSSALHFGGSNNIAVAETE